MTDIASDLADKIIALINSKPRSPSKDELVGLINESAFAVDAEEKIKACNPMMAVGVDPARPGSDRTVGTLAWFDPEWPIMSRYIEEANKRNVEFNEAQAAGRAALREHKLRFVEAIKERSRGNASMKSAKTDSTP